MLVEQDQESLAPDLEEPRDKRQMSRPLREKESNRCGGMILQKGSLRGRSPFALIVMVLDV